MIVSNDDAFLEKEAETYRGLGAVVRTMRAHGLSNPTAWKELSDRMNHKRSALMAGGVYPVGDFTWLLEYVKNNNPDVVRILNFPNAYPENIGRWVNTAHSQILLYDKDANKDQAQKLMDGLKRGFTELEKTGRTHS